MDADVMVVGAGPAGCAAAYDLTANGIRVLLVDRTEFPRRKVCAGGLTIKTIRALRYSVDPVIQRTVRRLTVSCRMRRQRRLEGPDPVCHLVERSTFDRFCLDQTMAGGARFAVVHRIDAIVETDRDVTVVTDDGRLRSRYVIGADGVHSRVRQLTGRFAGCRKAFAVEGAVHRHPSDDPAMGFDFNQLDGGYGWVFPKGDHLNVGLYTFRPDIPITRQALIRYANRRIGAPPPLPIRGYPLGVGGWRYRPGRGRVLLAGDAAGLVDPLLGEGLYHAVLSGQRAAGAVATAMTTGGDACAAYAGRLLGIQRDLLFSWLAANLFYRLPALGHRLLTAPAAAVPLMRGFSMGLPLPRIFLQGYRFWLGMPIPDGDPDTF